MKVEIILRTICNAYVFTENIVHWEILQWNLINVLRTRIAVAAILWNPGRLCWLPYEWNRVTYLYTSNRWINVFQWNSLQCTICIFFSTRQHTTKNKRWSILHPVLSVIRCRNQRMMACVSIYLWRAWC